MGLSTTRLLSTAMMFTITSAGGALSPTLPGSFSIKWLTTLVAGGQRQCIRSRGRPHRMHGDLGRSPAAKDPRGSTRGCFKLSAKTPWHLGEEQRAR